MVDVLDRSDQFAELAAELGARPEVVDDQLGPAPVHVSFAVDDNTALSANYSPPPLDRDELVSACLATPPASWASRDDWRRRVGALAGAAIDDPSGAEFLRELMHRLSSRPGSYEQAFPGGYDPGANDAEWDQLLADTGRRLARGRPVVTLGSLYREAKDNGWRPVPAAPADFTAGAESPISGAFGGIDPFQLSNVLPIPYKRRPVHGGLGYIGEVTLLVSAGGLAKSTYMTSACLAVAFGRDLLGHAVPNPLKTVYVNAEDRRGEMGLRFGAGLKHFGLSGPAVHRVFVFGAGDVPGVVLTEVAQSGRHEQVSARGLRELHDLIAERRARFVVLDPLAALLPNGGNDNGLMAAVMRGLKRIAEDLDCAIVVVAHTRKGSNVETDGAEITSGAAALTNLARGVKSVLRPKADVLADIGVPFGQDGNIRELVDLKANLGPLSNSEYFRLVAVPMGNATAEYPDEDWVAVAEQFVPQPGARTIPTAALRDVLAAIAQGVRGAPYSPASQAKERYFVPAATAALQPHFPNMSDSQRSAVAKEAYACAGARGWIDVQPATIPGSRNKRDGIFVRWDATPWAGDPPPGPFMT